MTIAVARQLVGIGFSYPLAAEIAKQIDSGVGNYRRLMALGVPMGLAKGMAEAIDGDSITAPYLASLGLASEQARVFIIALGGGAGQGAAFVLADDSNGVARRVYADNSTGQERFVTADKGTA